MIPKSQTRQEEQPEEKKNSTLTFMIKSPFARAQGRKRVPDWNPLFQPVTPKEFHSLGLYPQHMQAISQKLSEVRSKVDGKLVKEQLKAWFSSLSVPDRIRALTLRAPMITWIIKHMHTRSVLFEDRLYSFTVKDSQISYKASREPTQPVSPERRQAEKRLIDGIRLADDEGVFDTLSASQNLVADSKALFRALEEVSQHGFARRVCSIGKATGYYTWEFPSWFDPGKENSLGAWVCANVERFLWLSYAVHLLSPQVPRPDAPGPLKEQPLILKYWRELNKEERAKIIVEFYKTVKEDKEETSYKLQAVLSLKITIRECKDETLVELILFTALSDMGVREVRRILLQIIRNKMSDKVASEIIKAESRGKPKSKADAKRDSAPKEEKDGLHGMDVGLLSGRKNERYAKLLQQHQRKDCAEEKDARSDSAGSDIEDSKRVSRDEDQKKPLPAGTRKETEKTVREVIERIVSEVLARVPGDQKEEMQKAEAEPGSEPEKKKKRKKHRKKKQNGNALKPEKAAVPKKAETEKPKEDVRSVSIPAADDTRECYEDMLDSAEIEKDHYYTSTSSADPSKLSATYSRVSDLITTKCRSIEVFNAKQFPMRSKLHAAIKSIACTCFDNPALEVVVFGSTRSGLAIETSDVDMGVTGLPLKSKEDVETAILKLEKALSGQKFVLGAEPILTARVVDMRDIVKSDGEENCQKVDIAFNKEGSRQMERAVEAAELSQRLMGRLPFLKEVTLALKGVLARSGLNVPFKGGISSYALLMFCAAYYSVFPRFQSAGECLLRLTDFYANYFNNMLYGIFCDGNSVAFFPLASPIHYEGLVIVDPFDNRSNVTTSLCRFQDIRGCFLRVFESLTSGEDSAVLM